MEKEKTRLDRIEEKLDMIQKEEKKKKTFKLPWKAKVSKKKAENGWVTVLYIKENRTMLFDKQPIDEQTIILDGVPRIVTPEETLIYKGKPFVIVPSWSTKPFSPTDNYEEAIKTGYAAQGWRLLINRVKSEAILAKKKINGMLIFGVIIAVIAIGYLATKGGLFK